MPRDDEAVLAALEREGVARGGADPEMLANPDMAVLRLHRRPPPALPLDVFGADWWSYIKGTAEAAACPPDYVAAPLLAATSALIGNARWAQVNEGWAEPPHLWCATVGDSGSGKSPGADALMRHILPAIEQRMQGDFPDQLRAWRAEAAAHESALDCWKLDVKEAAKRGYAPPLPPAGDTPPEPQAPRLCQSDVTIERVATLLATAAPKGLLVTRDELAGWLTGMTSYNDAGRAFWLEAYGGRPFRVERQKHQQPIDVPRLVVAVSGGTQPDRLAQLMRGVDDGLMARFCWFWPDSAPFKLSRAAPRTTWAMEALDKLRQLDLEPGEAGEPPNPVMVPLSEAALAHMEPFGREMQGRQQLAGGLMCSAYGKMRGLALRLSLVIQYVWWCGQGGMVSPPSEISEEAFQAAIRLITDYLVPMAERVYGDAAARTEDRNAATLARWIIRAKASEVHVRRMQRKDKLPGMQTADEIHAAARVLVDAGWLIPPTVGFGAASKQAYQVNPRVLELEAEGA